MDNHLTKFSIPILLTFAASSFAATPSAPATQGNSQPIIIEQGYVADHNDVVDPEEREDEVFDEHAEKEPKVYDDPDEFEYGGYRGGAAHGGGGGGRR